MVYVAIGMIGATVMPHNLYLHSALVQSRKLQEDDASIRRAIRFNTIDSTTALTVAFLVNAAILVLAAVVFYGKTSVTAADGQVVTFSPDSDWIRIAYLTLAPLLGHVYRQHVVRRRPARERTEQHDHGHTRRASGHGRLHALARAAVGATDDHAHAGDYPCGPGHWPPRRQQRERSADAQPGRVGAAVAVRDVPAAPLHLLAQAHGRVEARLVSPHRWLGQCAVDHRDGRVRAARFAEIGVACHRRRLTTDSRLRRTRV